MQCLVQLTKRLIDSLHNIARHWTERQHSDWPFKCWQPMAATKAWHWLRLYNKRYATGAGVPALSSVYRRKICGICRIPSVNKRILCVVENPADVFVIEQTASFRGLYYILQGHLSPLDGIGPQEIGIPRVIRTIAK